ncbi:DUF4260 domain-containing protein [Aridibaculum aurantiacum]|uniref:DUF4260 domain-containing protein n=1 Tax=Aridibaculum aurantiacum TaxID=2810307 RepID=UPI001A97C31E|nr:DUF4260 domain-containing protein [Aridibaculum aurantiacum]
MKKLINLEEAAKFLLSFLVFIQLGNSWWLYFALLFLPDLSMIGYAFNNRVGAAAYNLFHHQAVAIATLVAGYLLQADYLVIIGIILFGHSALDRMLGYGLKYPDSFSHTHLGWIGKEKSRASN